MSVENNKAFIRQYFAELSSGDKIQACKRYVTDNNLIEHIEMFEAAFPGYQLAVEDMVAEDDKVVVRGIMTGTHRGAFMGIPATGKPVTVPVMVIYQVAGGKIVKFWIQADTLALLQQLGAMSTAAPA
jgi:steroid delta-isomerase-like uncharacterized protein